MSGIHCLVFSKDRAMQLDAFVRSAKRFAPYRSVEVVYSTGKALELAVRRFVQAHERVSFHTDDDVWFRAPQDFHDSPEIVSYRLGTNTTYCHPLDIEQKVPALFPWRWRDADGDFGYPLCLNGTVYRSADLLPLMGFPFANPTELEAGLDYRRELFKPELMTAPAHSCCVSLPHNRVSSSSGCRTGANPDWQPDALRERYLAGDRIDLDAMDFSDVNAAHMEVPLAFARRQG